MPNGARAVPRMIGRAHSADDLLCVADNHIFTDDETDLFVRKAMELGREHDTKWWARVHMCAEAGSKLENIAKEKAGDEVFML